MNIPDFSVDVEFKLSVRMMFAVPSSLLSFAIHCLERDQRHDATQAQSDREEVLRISRPVNPIILPRHRVRVRGNLSMSSC